MLQILFRWILEHDHISCHYDVDFRKILGLVYSCLINLTNVPQQHMFYMMYISIRFNFTIHLVLNFVL